MILLQVFLILLNAVFASAEIAVISINDAKLARMAAEGDKRAVRLARLTSQPARFLATIQVAITLSGFLGSAFAAENFSDGLVSWLVGLGVGIPAATLDAIAVVIITLVLSYFTLIFGELVPKRVAMRKAESLALGISGLISAIAKLFAPIVWFLTASTNAVLRLLGIDPNAEEETVSEEEIRMMVDVGTQKGTIDHEEKQFIQNVFEFDDLTAGEIATHRTDLTILWLEESMEEWASTIHNSRHTRYPVCGESADDVVGILNAKDYFRLTDRSREAVLEQAVETPYLVPDSVKADVLFRNMKSGCHPLAVVLDEYGGMTGIVTINDLVEQLVGDLGEEDVCRSALPLIEAVDSGTWKIRGEAPLEEVAQVLGVTLPCDDFDTFNGLVFGAVATIPEDGATIEVETAGLVIRVTEIRNHQVVMALVCLAKPQNTETQEHNRGEHE
ncbi:hemolysin [Flavonifractor sp. An92]|uniref:hemolysin family protein n=1 Tax=Flavonifractor sp. An92 TaxID=1965666 RepID=UPI000B3A218D|nr:MULTISPECIES: hemolysin family protein [unclassified Flavonifractor]OUN02740.1 hemolysin [Flavonifractor sp. An92]OUQ23013.1 hemolysin [Flavonifractor sp. An135]